MQQAKRSSGAQSSLMHDLISGSISLKHSKSCSALITPLSIMEIIAMTPACLILICGLPTFHFIDFVKMFKYTRTAWGWRAWRIYGDSNNFSRSTRVSIRMAISQSSDMQYSITTRTSSMNLIASPLQFLTMVSNLNLFLLVFVHCRYYFDEIIDDKIGPTSCEWS